LRGVAYQEAFLRPQRPVAISGLAQASVDYPVNSQSLEGGASSAHVEAPAPQFSLGKHLLLIPC
jgi:hypothetical protein